MITHKSLPTQPICRTTKDQEQVPWSYPKASEQEHIEPAKPFPNNHSRQQTLHSMWVFQSLPDHHICEISPTQTLAYTVTRTSQYWVCWMAGKQEIPLWGQRQSPMPGVIGETGPGETQNVQRSNTKHLSAHLCAVSVSQHHTRSQSQLPAREVRRKLSEAGCPTTAALQSLLHWRWLNQALKDGPANVLSNKLRSHGPSEANPHAILTFCQMFLQS